MWHDMLGLRNFYSSHDHHATTEYAKYLELLELKDKYGGYNAYNYGTDALGNETPIMRLDFGPQVHAQRLIFCIVVFSHLNSL